jgi:hypothetical protein
MTDEEDEEQLDEGLMAKGRFDETRARLEDDRGEQDAREDRRRHDSDQHAGLAEHGPAFVSAFLR